MKRKPGRPIQQKFKLRPHDRGKLMKIISEKAQHSARTFQRARMLLILAEGAGLTETAEKLGIALQTVRSRRDLYRQEGLRRALYDATRPGQPRKLTKEQEQQIVAIACSEPPDGYSHWSHVLLATEAVKRGITDSISRHCVAVLLERHELKPRREKNVVCSKAE